MEKLQLGKDPGPDSQTGGRRRAEWVHWPDPTHPAGPGGEGWLCPTDYKPLMSVENPVTYRRLSLDHCNTEFNLKTWWFSGKFGCYEGHLFSMISQRICIVSVFRSCTFLSRSNLLKFLFVSMSWCCLIYSIKMMPAAVSGSVWTSRKEITASPRPLSQTES